MSWGVGGVSDMMVEVGHGHNGSLLNHDRNWDFLLRTWNATVLTQGL